MANDITPKHEIYNTGIELHDISGWSRHTVADGKWLNINTIKPVSADLNILASAIHDTSGALQDDVDYLSANIDNLSGELYDTSSYLNEEIIKINARADVTDVVGTYAEFESLSASAIAGTYDISDRDIIKVLNNEASGNCQSYYRYLSADPYHWEYVGDLEPYYNNKTWSDGSNNHGILELNNTNSIRNFKLGGDNYVEFVKMSGVDEYDFRLNDDFINSASQCYTVLTSHSASWDETSATLNANSGYWDQAYTALTSHSASWNETSATLNANSGYWDQAYDWSKNSSANLISVSSTFVEYSGKWNDASATLYNNSANWQATYSAVSSNSAIWNESAYVPLSALECKIGSANTVEVYSFAQGLSNTAEYTAFAQGITNNVTMDAFSQGISNTAAQEAFTQGSGNNAEINSFAQGKANSAAHTALAQGQENIAISYSFAQGYKNEVNASDDGIGMSFAQGYANTADIISFAQGRNNSVIDKSFAQGSANSASNNGFTRGVRNLANGGFANGTDNTANGAGSLTIGANNYAGTYAQALGHGVKMIGSTNVPVRGGMAIGTYNKTSADRAFVIGNGTSDSNRSDLYWIDYDGNVYTEGNVSATNFYIDGSPINSVVSAKFSAYNGDTKIAEFPISAFKLQANTAKYISATTAVNTMIFNVSDALINSASSGYQAKQWINASGDSIIGSAQSGAAASAWIKASGDSIVGSAKSGAAASAWINTNGDNIIGSAQSGAAASAYIATNGVGTKVGTWANEGHGGYFSQYQSLVLNNNGIYDTDSDPSTLTPIGYYVPAYGLSQTGYVLKSSPLGTGVYWDDPDPAGSSEVEIEVGETGGYTKIVNAIASGNTPVLVKTGQYGAKDRYIFTEILTNGGGYRFVKPAASNNSTTMYTYTVQTGDVYDSDKYDSIPKPAAATSGNIAMFDSSRKVIDSEHGFSNYASGNVKTMAYNDVFPTSQQIKRDDSTYAYMYIENTVRRIAVGISNDGNVRIGEETGGSSSPGSKQTIIGSNGTGNNTKYYFNGSAYSAYQATSAYSAYYATSAISAGVALSAENSVRLGGKPAYAYALVSGTYTASTGLKVYSAIYANDATKWNGYSLVFNRLPTQGANEIAFI